MLEFIKTVKSAINHWYLLLLSGILLIALGIWTFREPVDSYATLAFIFALAFVVSGLVETYFSIANRKILDGWGWYLASGIFTLTVGVLMFMNPGITMITLPFYVGFVVLFRSINAISVSLDLKKYMVPGWGTMMGIGILGILFAFILLWNPLFAGLSIVVWTGIALIVAGVFSIMHSFELRKLNNLPHKISKGLMKKYDEIQSQIQEELSKNNQ